MSETAFHRIAEIINAMEPIPSDGYFNEFWSSLDSNLIKQKHFLDLENYLQDAEEDQWKLRLPDLIKKI